MEELVLGRRFRHILVVFVCLFSVTLSFKVVLFLKKKRKSHSMSETGAAKGENEADDIAKHMIDVLVNAFQAREGRDPTPDEVGEMLEEMTEERIAEMLGGDAIGSSADANNSSTGPVPIDQNGDETKAAVGPGDGDGEKEKEVKEEKEVDVDDASDDDHDDVIVPEIKWGAHPVVTVMGKRTPPKPARMQTLVRNALLLKLRMQQ